MSKHKQNEVSVEEMMLSDGRRAERHISYDDEGREIVEIFAEEKRPLKLEKRIIKTMESVVAEEVVETVKDGVVALREVKAHPQVPLQMVERIAIADHAKLVDGDYLKKEDLGALVAEMVSAFKEMNQKPEPIFKAQSEVARHVEEKKNSDFTTIALMVGCIIFQIGVFVFYYNYVM